ncbi:chromosome partitioning protein ParB [Ktedonobacter sp. SOSP1-85]|uniref:ParB/RepB/Spo0J family partition protein n=1 Tax=Ktedonobacter sp. SOSP1-85 TaxID=2778367 RepID=UPI00191635FF|nr:ParB/RepB/Spo0J family partition protein [Ktedonobacter sp. SOSP1-85]GHO74641.1 chromosome partitioning protein ParB [Ktedonobacter sp. SOSP1-85]
MAKQRFGLGRGLDALISGASDVMGPQQQAPAANADVGALPLLSLESIIPNPRQPRKVFRDDDPKLLELSASIKEHGLLQPIVVARLDQVEKRADTGDSWFGEPGESTSAVVSNDEAIVRYQIIAGERRWRASKMAGLKQVPVVVKEVTPQQMLELALIENIQRADLNPIEEAMAYQELVQTFGLTQEQVARQVGKDRSTITNSLRLLQLAPKLREALVNQPDIFTEGHARALAGITREEDQVTAMNQVIALHLNVRQTEELASRIKASQDIEAAVKKITTTSGRTPELESLESQFRDSLMVKVDLKCNAKGKGTLVLHFNDQDELEGLYSRLVKKEDAE